MKKLLIIIAVLLVALPAWADVDTLEGQTFDDTVTVEGVAGVASIEGQVADSGIDWSPVQMFWRAENSDSMGSGDKQPTGCSPSCTWANQGGGGTNCTYSSSTKKYGSYSLHCAPANDRKYLYVAGGLGLDNDTFAVGWWMYINALPEADGSSYNIPYSYQIDGANESRMVLYGGTPGAAGNLWLEYENDDPSSCGFTNPASESGNPFENEPSGWHFVQISYNMAGNTIKFYIDGYSESNSDWEKTNCSVTAWGSSGLYFYFGGDGTFDGERDIYLDNLIFVNDHTINLYQAGYADDITAP